ncbi:LLM class flavin-dependent oxidoreductase [Haloterrigena alkaliphila]|uniref:LLM class flavin-dependent oxidoreductase n=1 Tax=Haloterrigena alkaliphila TaxID=2816475 RepID=UPI001CFF8E20|nr:LLM class flavin-dependent oxidoreductase [Haloterrigena alkaliphila]UHQ95206.1 LLM class flavin-dependent oxidoreductase [Haloterrigena alkaliphila]
MNHGVGLFPESVSAAVSFVKYVDDSPYEKLWITDSHRLYTDPYVTLAQCAEATDRIELSTGVTNPITRHPTVTANAIASVNEISDGRTTLAIGAGDSAVYSIGKTPAGVTELADSVTDIRALFDGEMVEFDGEPFALEAGEPPTAVHVAAEGPKTLRMAGEVGDGVIFGGGTDPEAVDAAFERIAAGCADAGRSIDDVTVTALAPTCVAETTAEAVDELLDILEPIAYHNFSVSTDDAPPDLRLELERLVDRHDMAEHGQSDAAPARSLSDDLKRYLGDRFAIAGPPERCRDRIASLADRGVDAVYHGFPTRDVPGHARTFAERVLDE